MGSVQLFGEECPVCHRRSMMIDHFHHTGEEFRMCRCCGYRRSRTWSRNGGGGLEDRPGASADPAGQEICIGIPARLAEDGRVLELQDARRIRDPMDAMMLELLLQRDARWGLFQKDGDEYVRLNRTRYASVRLDGAVLTVMEPEMLDEESGGSGVIVIARDDGSEYERTLREPMAPDDAIASLPENERKRVVAVASFSPRGGNPVCYGISPEDWFARSER